MICAAFYAEVAKLGRGPIRAMDGIDPGVVARLGELSKRVRMVLVGVLTALLVAVAAGPVGADRRGDYRSDEAGHPVKIAYYILYPVGLLIDVVILRPAHWLGQREPFRTVFGVKAVPDYAEVDPETGAEAVD